MFAYSRRMTEKEESRSHVFRGREYQPFYLPKHCSKGIELFDLPYEKKVPCVGNQEPVTRRFEDVKIRRCEDEKM